SGEHHGCNDIDGGKTATDAADDELGETDNLLGQVCGIHQVAGEDEEGDGEQDKLIDPGNHALRERQHEIEIAGDQEVEQRRQPEAECDRYADGEKDAEADQVDCHGLSPAVLAASNSRRQRTVWAAT